MSGDTASPALDDAHAMQAPARPRRSTVDRVAARDSVMHHRQPVIAILLSSCLLYETPSIGPGGHAFLIAKRSVNMEKRRIGSLEVSAIGLGCNNFGQRLDFARSAE